jgi:hypothetical protein
MLQLRIALFSRLILCRLVVEIDNRILNMTALIDKQRRKGNKQQQQQQQEKEKKTT